jgi:hypothetical protein
MPNNTEVRDFVVSQVAKYSGMKPGKVQLTYVLKDPPLRMDNPGLSNLTLALREYLKSYAGGVIKITEVKKSGLTAGGLVEMIITKLNAV